jgi:hypothetical protein
MEFSSEYEVITEAQFGFKKQSGTRDAIFALHGIISETLRKKKKLYCCFIDYSKAFDCVNRYHLWRKMVKQGIRGKLLGVIKSLYTDFKAYVRNRGDISKLFDVDSGLIQGEALSPLMYSLYVNDFELFLSENNCNGLELGSLNLYLLMYADDTVLFAESASELQNLLNKLEVYSKSWNLSVNATKTKIVVFRNGGKMKTNECWIYDNHQIEIVDNFNYLGVVFNYNGKFRFTQEIVADQGRKAIFGLKNSCKDVSLNVETELYMFDTYVMPILNYGCETWGFHKAPNIDKVFTQFCKHLLGISRKAINAAVFNELGVLPMKY